MSSPEPEDNDFQFVHQTELRSLEYMSRENNVVNDEASENNESGGHLVGPQSATESTQLQRFQTNNPRLLGESSSSQIFKHHLKKLHVAVNKILEVDRSSKHKSLSKKNFRNNQEAYDKMLDAVRELGSFVVQRQNAPSSSGDHSRTLEEMKFRFSKRVRSKSTTYDDPISHGLSPSSKTKHLPKSTRRTTSLTKRSKSPYHRSTSSQPPASNGRQSYHAKQLNNIENVKIFHHAKTTYKVPTNKTTNANTDPVTENVSTQKYTDPEIACLEAELSHRDTLIQYLSEQLSKLYQDNDRIFAEYEFQEANLTNHLRMLRSRLTETSDNLSRRPPAPAPPPSSTTAYLHTDYTTQSITTSQQINFNVTDSIVHNFATELNHQLTATIDDNNHSDQLQPQQQQQQQQSTSLYQVELQELGMAVQNLLTYWEIKSKEINYPVVCQQFFQSLLNFFNISLNSLSKPSPPPPPQPQELPQLLNSNLNELKLRAETAEQQVGHLSNEIKNYEFQLRQLNEQFSRRVEQEVTERLKRADQLSMGLMSSSTTFQGRGEEEEGGSQAPTIATTTTTTDIDNSLDDELKDSKLPQPPPAPLPPSSSSVGKIHKHPLKLMSSKAVESTIPVQAIPVPMASTTILPTTTMSDNRSINDLLQRIWACLLSRESELKSMEVQKSKLWLVKKEEYETLLEAYRIIEQFQLNQQRQQQEQEEQQQQNDYLKPEPVIVVEIDTRSSQAATSTLDPKNEDVNNASTDTQTRHTLPDQYNTTTTTSTYDKDEWEEIVTVRSIRKEKSYSTKSCTKSVQQSDVSTSTSDLTLDAEEVQQQQQEADKECKPKEDHITPLHNRVEMILVNTSVIRELQGKLNSLKSSHLQLINQFHTFNQLISNQLDCVKLMFNRYSEQTRTTDETLGIRNALEGEDETRDLVVVVNNQNWWSTEPDLPTNDAYLKELIELKLQYENIQDQLSKSEEESRVLKANLQDIENQLKLSISENQLTDLKEMMELVDCENSSHMRRCMFKAYIDYVNQILHEHKTNCRLPFSYQPSQVENQYDEPDYQLYTLNESLHRISELHQLLLQQQQQQQELSRNQQSSFSVDIEQDQYPFSQEIDKLLDDDKTESVTVSQSEFTERLGHAINIIYEELIRCQRLVDKLLNDKANHCNIISQQANDIQQLNERLIAIQNDSMKQVYPSDEIAQQWQYTQTYMTPGPVEDSTQPDDITDQFIETEQVPPIMTSPTQIEGTEVTDVHQPSKPSLSEYNALDELCRDLQRALDTRSSELETVVEKMRGFESVNAALTRECDLLKHRVEKYTRVTSDLENDVSRAKALVPLVVNELRDLRTDYGDWCREHEERVGECIEAVGTALSAVSSSLDDGGVVERVDRDCGTSDWPEELDASVSEMRRLCDSNRELSEDLCKYRELCDKQASEISSMQVALREAVEQASSARDELEAYRQEKVSALSELERRLAVSSEECCALQAEVQRLEKSIEENCKTAVAIASRDWELHIEQVTSERDTALRELVELRGRLEAAESVKIGGVEEAGAGSLSGHFASSSFQSPLSLVQSREPVQSFTSGLDSELSHLRREFSKTSMSLMYAVDLVDDCFNLLLLFIRLLTEILNTSSSTILDAEMSSSVINNLKNILSITNSTYFVEYFGDYTPVLSEFTNLCDLIASNQQSSACSICHRIIVPNDSIILSSLCMNCSTDLEGLDYAIFREFIDSSEKNRYSDVASTEHPTTNGTNDEIIETARQSSTCLSVPVKKENEIRDTTNENAITTIPSELIHTVKDLEDKLLIAESERNRLNQLIYSLSMPTSTTSCSSSTQDNDEYKQLQLDYSNINNTNKHLKLFIHELFEEIYKYTKVSIEESSSTSSLIESLQKLIRLNHQVNDFIDLEDISRRFETIIEQLKQLKDTNKEDDDVDDILEMQKRLEQMQSDYEKLCFENIYLTKKINTQLSIDNQDKLDIGRGILNCTIEQLKQLNTMINKSIIDKSCYPLVNIDDTFKTLEEIHLSENLMLALNTSEYKSEIIRCYQCVKQLIEENLKLKTLQDLKVSSPSDVNADDDNDGDTPPAYQLDANLHEQFSTLETSLSTTMNCLLNRVDELTQRIDVLQNGIEKSSRHVKSSQADRLEQLQQDMSNQMLNDQLTSLKQRDIEWEVNINTLYNCLSQVITSDDKDKGRRQKDDEEVENEDAKSTKQPIHHPNEILPQFNQFINTAQTQINRIASLENQYNELNLQLNQLSEEYEQARCEVKRLQTTASQQTNDADKYTNMLDYLVAKIIDLSSELPDPSSSPSDDQDHELDVIRIPKSSSSTDIELILIRIKKYLCEYKSIQEKLRQVEEEKASLINRLAKQYDHQPEEVVEQEEVHTTLPVFSLEKPVEKIETVDTECLQMMSYAMPPPSAPPSSHKGTKPVIDQLSSMKDDIMLLRCETTNMIETMNQKLESTIEYTTACLIDTNASKKISTQQTSSSSLLKKSEILFNFTKDLTTTVSLEPSISDDPLGETSLEVISEDDLTVFVNALLNRISDTLKERNQPPSPSPPQPPPTTLDGDIHLIDSKLMHNYSVLINKLSSILHLPTTSYRSDQFINAQIEEILNRLPNLLTNQKMNELCEYIDQLLIDLTDMMMMMMMSNVVIEQSDQYSIKVDELSEYLITNSLESTNLPERFIKLHKLLLLHNHHRQLSQQRQTPPPKTLVDVYSTGGGGVGRGQVETTEEVSRIESVSILRNIIKSCIIHENNYRLLQSQLSQDAAVSSLTITDTLDNDLLTLSFNELIDLLTQKWLQLDNRLKEFIDYIRLYHLRERDVISEQIDYKPQQQQQQQSVQRTTEHQLPFRRYRSNSFSYSPRLSCCCNNNKLVSIRNKNKSMLTLSTTSSTTTTLLHYTSLLELLTVLELYTPAFLMHVKPMKEMHLTYHLKANTMKCGLQQLRRHLMQLTPSTHEQEEEQQQQQTATRYTEELNTYLQHINTYLHVKELCTKQALNDLRSELISLNRQKHKLLKRKVSNVTTATTTSTKAVSLLPVPSTSSSVSIISTSSNILPTVIYEDEEVLQEKLVCTKDRLKQTILIYKCIQELLNYQSDYYYHYNLKSIHNAQEVTGDHDDDRGRRLSGRGSTLCRSQLSNYANADDYWAETDIDAEYTHDRNRDLDQSQTTLLCNYDPDDGNLLYIGSSSSGNNYQEHRDQYNELEYALRLLHIRDTELLYLISLQHDNNNNINTDTGYNNLKFNLSATSAAYTTNKDISSSSSQWLKEKLDKFMHWNNVQPINMHNIPIHRIEFSQPQHLQQLQPQQQPQIIDIMTTTPNLLVKSHLLSSTDDERSTALFTSQSFDHMTYYYEDETDIYEQHLYTLVQIALNKLDQLNKSYAEPKRPLLLSPDREDELTELLDRVIKLIPLESHVNQISKTTDSESIYSQLGRRLTTTAAAAATTTTTIMMTTTPAAITAIMTTTTATLSTGPSSSISSSAAYPHYYNNKPVSSTTCDSSDLSLMTNMTYPYPKRAEKAPIHDLVDSVDHLRNLHELRSLAKYLLDQYHIVTTELELQSDTNWCLRQRLSNANSQLDRLTDLLNKSSRTFQSIDERLTAEIHKHSTLTEQCDIARQDTRRVVHTLSEINQRHKPTSGRRLNFVPDSSEYLIKSSGPSSSIQTMESKSAYKLKSKSQISQSTTTSTSMQSRISDPDFFVLNRVYVPFRMMQSISSQTEKRCRLSCLPYSASSRLTCGPKLKRPTSRSSSSNKLTNDRSDSRKRHQSSSASTPTVVIPISSSTTYRRPSNTRSQERGGEARGGEGGVVDVHSEGVNTQQTNNNNNYTSWSEFESGQRKLQSVSLSIEKDLLRYYHHQHQHQDESASHLGVPCSSSTMITEEHEEEDEDEEAEKSKEHPCETHPLLEEYYRNQEQQSLSSPPPTALMKSENSTSSQSTSSSLSFTSLESHSRRSAAPGGNNESQASGSRGDRQLPLRQKKTKFPSRFMNLFNKSNYKKS